MQTTAVKTKRPTFPAFKPETTLERHVAKWIRDRARDYPDTGAQGVLKDLFYGGCSSGMVGHLIYTRDCAAFYKRHRKEISGMLRDALSETGAHGPGELFCNPNAIQWDEEDPLAQDDLNQTILAHFGFEETARRLADRAGIEV